MSKKPVTSPTNRSRVTGGNTLFLPGIGEVDGRSAVARRFRDLVHIFTEDQGGPDGLSEAQHQLARRSAFLSVQCETLEAKAAAGTITPEETDLYNRTTGMLLKVLTTAGLKRQAKDVTPNGKVLDAHAMAVLAGGGR